MNTRCTTWSRYGLSVLMAAAWLPWVAGCGGEQATAVFDAAALLERIEQDRRRHDPHAYSELDLGEFTITWRGGTAASPETDGRHANAEEEHAPKDASKDSHAQQAEHAQQTEPAQETPHAPPTSDQQPATSNLPPPTLIIRFHLYAVVSDNQLEECRVLLETHGERVRSQVRETVQGSAQTQLEDPALGWLKSDLIQSINQSLQAPILRDVAFAEFALDRA
jgi:hypothetical protein